MARPAGDIPFLVTNSTLFCWHYLCENQSLCQLSQRCSGTLPKHTTPDNVLVSLKLQYQHKRGDWSSLMGAVTAEKALQGSVTEPREWLAGKDGVPKWGIINIPSNQMNDLLKKATSKWSVSGQTWRHQINVETFPCSGNCGAPPTQNLFPAVRQQVRLDFPVVSEIGFAVKYQIHMITSLEKNFEERSWPSWLDGRDIQHLSKIPWR